jgi:hypothetical protein
MSFVGLNEWVAILHLSKHHYFAIVPRMRHWVNNVMSQRSEITLRSIPHPEKFISWSMEHKKQMQEFRMDDSDMQIFRSFFNSSEQMQSVLSRCASIVTMRRKALVFIDAQELIISEWEM